MYFSLFYRYTRNLVDEGNGKFNLMILCWNESQGSSIHSHANAHCFLKVIGGTLQEEMYAWPSSSEEDNEMKPVSISKFQTNQVTYINGKISLNVVFDIISVHVCSSCAYPDGRGQGVWTPPDKSQNIGFLRIP